MEKILEIFHEKVYIEGDATDSDTLLKAGIMEAKGLFAVSGDDNQNLVISLTAKQLNPNIRVVARCHDLKNMEKMKKAGADAVVSPTFIGGLRMASEMVRPTVVSFLDIMLRDKEKNLRVEEIPVPESIIGKTIANLQLDKYPNVLLLAVRTKDNWIFNPPEDYLIKPENVLIFMSTPQERQELERIFSTT
ncbi:TrkA family potassium uptake protein [Dissulfurispira thermophila]|uniref:potassium channel family protein n=1 Tax=Dissulfurispira thermophila TaxID=2715679 RepID=UPI0030EF5AF0